MRLTLVSHMPHRVTVGGAQEALREAVDRLAARGHDVTVLCATPPRLPGAPTATSPAAVEVIEHENIENLLAAGRTHVLARRPDVVLVPAEDPSQRPLRAVSGLGIPTVVLAQTPATLPFGPGSARRDPVAHGLLLSATRVLASSAFLTDYIRRHGDLDARAVSLPAAISGTRRIDLRGRDRVLMINPSIIKGRTVLTALARRFPTQRFAAVVGWATNEDDLLALAAYDNIEVLSSSHNIGHYLDSARVLLVPSLWLENVPLVIGEALRAGVPVLASDIGGIPEALDGLGTLLPVVPIRWQSGARGGQQTPVAPEQPVDRWATALRGELGTPDAAWERRSAQLAADARRRAARVDIMSLKTALEEVIGSG